MTKADPKLKPCPFCGKTENVIKHLDGDVWNIWCGSCGMQDASYIKEESSIEHWNAAYCWKEIDSLRVELARKDKALKLIANGNLNKNDAWFIAKLALSPEIITDERISNGTIGIVQDEKLKGVITNLRPEEGGKEKADEK